MPPEPSSNQIKRPRNCWIIFRQTMEKQLETQFPREPRGARSKRLSEMWNNISLEEKNKYVNEQELEKLRHLEKYPNYKYQPQKRAKAKAKEGNKGAQNISPEDCESPGRSLSGPTITESSENTKAFLYNYQGSFSSNSHNVQQSAAISASSYQASETPYHRSRNRNWVCSPSGGPPLQIVSPQQVNETTGASQDFGQHHAGLSARFSAAMHQMSVVDGNPRPTNPLTTPGFSTPSLNLGTGDPSSFADFDLLNNHALDENSVNVSTGDMNNIFGPVPWDLNSTMSRQASRIQRQPQSQPQTQLPQMSNYSQSSTTVQATSSISDTQNVGTGGELQNINLFTNSMPHAMNMNRESVNGSTLQAQYETATIPLISFTPPFGVYYHQPQYQSQYQYPPDSSLLNYSTLPVNNSDGCNNNIVTSGVVTGEHSDTAPNITGAPQVHQQPEPPHAVSSFPSSTSSTSSTSSSSSSCSSITPDYNCSHPHHNSTQSQFQSLFPFPEHWMNSRMRDIGELHHSSNMNTNIIDSSLVAGSSSQYYQTEYYQALHGEYEDNPIENNLGCVENHSFSEAGAVLTA